MHSVESVPVDISEMMNKGKMKIGLNLSKLEIGKPTEAGQKTTASSGFGSFGSAKKPEPEKSIENEVRKVRTIYNAKRNNLTIYSHPLNRSTRILKKPRQSRTRWRASWGSRRLD